MPFGNKFQLGKNYCIVPWFHFGKKCVFDDVVGFLLNPINKIDVS